MADLRNVEYENVDGSMNGQLCFLLKIAINRPFTRMVCFQVLPV